MKEVKANVKPHMLLHVVHALEHGPDFPGLAVSEVKGFGTGKVHAGEHAISEDVVGFVAKVRIESVVPDEVADTVAECIVKRGRTGLEGDGKIFVSDVERATRIRTGESGVAALARSELPGKSIG